MILNGYIYGGDIMFYTGVYAMNDRSIQRAHKTAEPFDDDVFSWFDKSHKKLLGVSQRIYVSNVGTTATIHIKKRHNKPENIEFIKDQFNLRDIFGIAEVRVTEL